MSIGSGQNYTWFGPDGETELNFYGGGTYRITDMDGLNYNPSNIRDTRAPGQYGNTASDLIIGPRKISFTIIGEARSMGELLAMQEYLTKSFKTLPRRPGQSLRTGTFRVTRNAYPILLNDLEIEAIPEDSPKITILSPHALRADVDLVCPYPYFRYTFSQLQNFDSEGGFEFPVEFPLESTTNNIEAEANNAGTVPAPVLMRIYGDCTGARLRNLTTVEVIEIADQIESDQYVDIQTEFGQKSIMLTDTGSNTTINALSRLSLDKADFWWLQPGINLIRFEADVNVSGHASITWVPRFSGV